MVNGNTTNFNYKRTITHVDYDKPEGDVKHKWLKGVMSKQITNPEKCEYNKVMFEDEPDSCPNNKYYHFIPLSDFTAKLMIGIFSFFIVITLLFMLKHKSFELVNIVFSGISLIGLGLCLAYLYTKPHKECIFNREDGLVTFPGFLWDKNITMPIEKLIFRISGPGGTGGSAFKLQIQRPDRFKTKYFSSLGNNCYQDLSFVLWYMDKNRPLPPGDAFDEYRDQDFERRKAAGFPKPMFPSTFETPEATPDRAEMISVLTKRIKYREATVLS